MSGRVVVLTGGIGGAKLVLGLVNTVPAESVTAIVNTGDDFTHLGLRVSPDIDTLLYTLSGKANAVQGWGREGESWNFMAALRSLGGAEWFALGDGDLALHVLRTAALARGERLSTIVAGFAKSWGIAAAVLPMSDDPVETIVETDQGILAFQEYFVARRCAPRVSAVRFVGVDAAVPAPGVVEAIADPKTRAILIAPSNPFLSVDPILAVPGLRARLAASPAPVVAVSPLVGGRAVKGPTGKLLDELGLAP
ncbi:MAG TPA: 2-phospho-L-lactate transferase CofD family protein, partial [Stellaceae bacterium]|nr:2-phospho-L-lactate transferase CofD family protein [Stellaceae bacterium]